MKENQSHEARRRAFIREHHPDRGGDAGAFIAGLRALDAEREQGSGLLPEVVVVRRRPWLVRKATAVGRRLRYGPRPSRVRLPVTACPLLVVLRRREKNLFVTWLGHRPFGGESRGLADGDVRQPVRFTQQSLTVPPEVTAKTRQKHDYPSAAHRRSYARRTGAERASPVKDPAASDITRDWCRLMDLTPLMLFTVTLLIARNQRILAAWTARQEEDQRRAARGLPPRTRKRRPQNPHGARRRPALTRS